MSPRGVLWDGEVKRSMCVAHLMYLSTDIGLYSLGPRGRQSGGGPSPKAVSSPTIYPSTTFAKKSILDLGMVDHINFILVVDTSIAMIL